MTAPAFTATEKLRAVERELGYRRKVFPRRVAAEQMTEQLAREQIAIFESIRDDYAALAAKERLL
jgi:hypothetical protein